MNNNQTGFDGGDGGSAAGCHGYGEMTQCLPTVIVGLLKGVRVHTVYLLTGER